jgi:hypothetical protein
MGIGGLGGGGRPPPPPQKILKKKKKKEKIEKRDNKHENTQQTCAFCLFVCLF